MRKRSQRESGQAAVETAITMPLFVFLILGTLQLGLLHQARVLAKYAAYKAARVGAIHSAKQSAMKRAAMAVMLPMTGQRKNYGGNQGMFFNATPEKFKQSWGTAKGWVSKGKDDPENPLKVTICDPTDSPKGDFDDPDGDMGMNGGWQQDNHGRLAIQVQQNQELVIPFANGVIFYMLIAEERAELYNTLRMRIKDDKNHKEWLKTRQTAVNGEKRSIDRFKDLAAKGTFIVPIRASWSMRMQSSYLQQGGDFKLPTQNFCRVSWKVQGSRKGVD